MINDVTRDSLLRPLQAVAGIVERRHTLPILSNVLLEPREGRLVLSATDLEIEISTVAECVTDAGSKALTTGARKLQDILRALPESATVSLQSQDQKLQVRSGSSKFSLQTLPAEDFPKLARTTVGSEAFSISQKKFKALLSLVQYAMAQQDVRYYLNGLLIVLGAGQLQLVATDGHRLAYAKCSLDGATGNKEVILPRKTVLELGKLLEDSEESVEVELSDAQARFRFGKTALVSKVIEGKFPDYNRVIPTQQDKIFVVERQALQQALQRVAILSSDKFRGVRLVLMDGLLRVSCTNNEQEEAQEELTIGYSGGSLDVGFNVGYLIDVLGNLSSKEVEVALRDANSSALITIPEREDFKYVVMPMRI